MKLLMVLMFMFCMIQMTHASTDRYLDGKYILNGGYTITIPSATDTLVGKETSDTLKNKTLSGTFNTFSSIPVGAIGNGSVLSGSNTGDVAVGAFGSTPNAYGFSISGQTISLQPADATHPGALTASDYSLFYGKQDALGFTAVPDTRTVNGHALSSDVTVTASDVSLGNVTNDAQVKKSEYTAKGDILVGTGSGAYSALAGSGTDGYIMTYDSNETSGVKWAAAPVVAPNIVGSVASPTLITAVGGIAFTGTNYSNINFIAGDSGAVTITANPQIAAATNVGQKLILVGDHATNTVTLADGNGLSLNGAWVAGLNSVIELVWNGTLWVEMNRR